MFKFLLVLLNGIQRFSKPKGGINAINMSTVNSDQYRGEKGGEGVGGVQKEIKRS